MQKSAILILILLLTSSFLTPMASSASTPEHYSVAVSESGLANGTGWYISVNGARLPTSNNSTIVFLVANGTYFITVPKVDGLSPVPGKFSITVDGHNLSYAVVFGSPLYTVTFNESGLPLGTLWNVTMGNTTESSSNSSASFQVRNGTYGYLVSSADGVNPSPSNGTVTVNGRNVSIPLRFVEIIQFTFLETGLPQGSHWGVKIQGNYYNSSTPIITVNLDNGTYGYSVYFPSGYSATPKAGELSWNNTVVVVNASSPLGYEIGISVLVILIALALTVHSIRKRRRKSENEKKGIEQKGN